MLKTGGASSEKRMYKFAKNRVSALVLAGFILFTFFLSLVLIKERKRREIKLKKFTLRFVHVLLLHKSHT